MEVSSQLETPAALNHTAGLDATPCQKQIFTDVSKERSAFVNGAV